MSYKIGETIKYAGEVALNGVLQDISAWTITGVARRDAVDGPVLGNFTLTRPSTGVFALKLATAGFTPCKVFCDAKLIDASGEIVYSSTDEFPLLPAVTP